MTAEIEQTVQKMPQLLMNAASKLVENLLSKKFMVFMAWTGLLLVDKVPSEYYLTVSMAVLGVQSVIDWKHPSRSLHPDDHTQL